MSLDARRALYFKFCVGARFRLTPQPTTQKEVTFLYESFLKLATLEYFNVQNTDHSHTNLFGRHVTVLFNASDQFSQLDPLGGMDPSIQTTVVNLQQRQRELKKHLKTICGIPRYSYIENDDLYFQGREQVPFKHTLISEARQYADQYQITASTVNSPFATINTKYKLSEVLASLRHNFQKFHKIEPVFVDTGKRAVLLITGEKYSVKVDLDANEIGDVDVTDLRKNPPIQKLQGSKSGLNGFLAK